MQTPSKRAAAGAAFLDEARPNWVESVNVHCLDMESASRCILGQMFGSYSEGIDALFGYWSTIERIDLGFTTEDDDWIALTDAWTDEILFREVQRLVRSESATESTT